VDTQKYVADPNGLIGSKYGLFLSQNVTIRGALSGTSSYLMSAYHSSGNKTYIIAGPGGSVTGN